jgi:hypothetical protein
MRQCGPPIDSPRGMSVVKRRCHGLTAIAQLAGAIGRAHNQIFYGCRKRACGSSGRRLVLAGASAELLRSAGDHRKGGIRIRSERKWPEKVVLDTNQPTFSSSSVEVAQAQEPVEHLPDEMMDHTSVESLAKSLAKPKPDVRAIVADHPPMRAKRGKARAVPSFHVARVRSLTELQGLGEACCWLEPMDGRATSRAGSRKRVARRDSWTGWHLQEAD